MTNLDKYFKILKSPKASVRYDACEELRVATESSREVVLALEEAANDEDESVAERARSALAADVHRQMGIKMGRYSPVSEKELEPDIEPEPEPPAQKIRRLAIASLVLGTLALVSSAIFLLMWENAPMGLYDVIGGVPLGFVMGLISIITGILACKQIKKYAVYKRCLAIAIVGIGFGILGCLPSGFAISIVVLHFLGFLSQ
jgi:hypothetical protein